MTLAEILKYLLSLGSKDLYVLAADMDTYAQELVAATKLPIMVFSVLGLVLGLFVGLLGYKLHRAVVATVSAGIGFFAGVELFLTFIYGKYDMIPVNCCYVVAAVPAVIFLIFAAKKPLGGIYMITAITGAIITSAYTTGVMEIVAGALLLTLIAGAAPRFTFATITSFVGALIAMVNLSRILPNVTLLQVKSGNLPALAILGTVFVVFILLQMLITIKKKTPAEE